MQVSNRSSRGELPQAALPYEPPKRDAAVGRRTAMGAIDPLLEQLKGNRGTDKISLGEGGPGGEFGSMYFRVDPFSFLESALL